MGLRSPTKITNILLFTNDCLFLINTQPHVFCGVCVIFPILSKGQNSKPLVHRRSTFWRAGSPEDRDLQASCLALQNVMGRPSGERGLGFRLLKLCPSRPPTCRYNSLSVVKTQKQLMESSALLFIMKKSRQTVRQRSRRDPMTRIRSRPPRTCTPLLLVTRPAPVVPVPLLVLFGVAPSPV